jgi:hypothetical protein
VLPPADIILRPEHGVVFDSVGIVDNNMSSWFQTFVVPVSIKAFNKISGVNSLKPDIGLRMSLNKNNDISTGGQNMLQSLMSDYDDRIHAILYDLAALQADTNA